MCLEVLSSVILVGDAVVVGSRRRRGGRRRGGRRRGGRCRGGRRRGGRRRCPVCTPIYKRRVLCVCSPPSAEICKLFLTLQVRVC